MTYHIVAVAFSPVVTIRQLQQAAGPTQSVTWRYPARYPERRQYPFVATCDLVHALSQDMA